MLQSNGQASEVFQCCVLIQISLHVHLHKSHQAQVQSWLECGESQRSTVNHPRVRGLRFREFWFPNLAKRFYWVYWFPVVSFVGIESRVLVLDMVESLPISRWRIDSDDIESGPELGPSMIGQAGGCVGSGNQIVSTTTSRDLDRFVEWKPIWNWLS